MDKLILCLACGAKNKVAAHSTALKAICGACQAPLGAPTTKPAATTSSTNAGTYALLFAICASLFGLYHFSQPSSPAIGNTTFTPNTIPSSNAFPESSHYNTHSSANPQFNNLIHSLASNSQTAPAQLTPVQIFPGVQEIASKAERIAPLEIVSAPGQNYFIKLIDLRNHQTTMTIYVQGGSKLEVLVPLGRYELKYATGTVWYGETDLFGPSTSYTKTDDEFTFRDEGYQVSGYTIELIRQAGGNLGSHPIQASQF